jgi:hypothetical protein
MYVSLTQIQAHFGVTMTGDFIINTLGVQPDASEKKAKFWKPEKVKDIARALVNHAAERGNVAIEGKSVPKASAAGPADNSDLW